MLRIPLVDPPGESPHHDTPFTPHLGAEQPVVLVKEVEDEVVDRGEGHVAADDHVLLGRVRHVELPAVRGVSSEGLRQLNQLLGHHLRDSVCDGM